MELNILLNLLIQQRKQLPIAKEADFNCRALIEFNERDLPLTIVSVISVAHYRTRLPVDIRTVNAVLQHILMLFDYLFCNLNMIVKGLIDKHSLEWIKYLSQFTHFVTCLKLSYFDILVNVISISRNFALGSSQNTFFLHAVHWNFPLCLKQTNYICKALMGSMD